MKFRTEIDVAPLRSAIGYDSRIFAVGSCFAGYVAERLAGAKFRVTANPTGVMFNPLSAADTVSRCASGTHVEPQELREGAGGWFHFGFHGSFSRLNAAEAAAAMNEAVDNGHRALSGADTVIVTFGTAYVFRLADSGATVANCHKQPAGMFRRERLSAEEIAGRWSRLIENELKGKHIILTVSPVRHLADGLDGNMLGKSILRVAAACLAERHENVDYFPAYEILCDDLRDYRFYADDLVHPSSQAIAYVRDKFFDAVLSEQTRSTLARVEKVVSAAEHRPFDSDSEAFRTFCRRALADIDALLHEAPDIDFTAERDYFTAFLQ